MSVFLKFSLNHKSIGVLFFKNEIKVSCNQQEKKIFNWRISPPMNMSVRNKMSAWPSFQATMTSDEDNEHLHDVFCYLHLIISKDWQVPKRFQLSVLRFSRALLAIRGPGADELKKAARCEIWQAATRKQIFYHHQTCLGITDMLSHFMAMSLEQKIRK